MPDQSPIETTQEPKLWKMTLYQGSAWPGYSFKINDAAGNPRDMSLADIFMDIKKISTVPGCIKRLTKGNGFLVSGTMNEWVSFDSTKVVDLDPDFYISDVLIVLPGNIPKYPFRFEITVKPSNSRTA
jgi:hypothetical protein